MSLEEVSEINSNMNDIQQKKLWDLNNTVFQQKKLIDDLKNSHQMLQQRVENELNMANKNMLELKEEHQKLLEQLVEHHELLYLLEENMSKEDKKVQNLELISVKMPKREKKIWNLYCQKYDKTIQGTELPWFTLEKLQKISKLNSEVIAVLRWLLDRESQRLDMICEYGKFGQ
jgi:hypothetical protein